MGVEDSLFQETLCSKNMKETIDEVEETLSLCDLPLYSDQSADWEQDFSLTSNSTTSSSSHEDCFEFFSQELNPSAADFPPENIVFCGKLIPYKQLPPCKPDSSNQAGINIQSNHTRKSHYRLNFNSQPKNANRSTTKVRLHQHKKTYNTTPTMSIVAAPQPSRKAKWHLFLFGISRFSPVVEVTDIRSRQRHRHSRLPPRFFSASSPPPMLGFRNCDDKVISGRRWGLLWGLIRALSCGENHQPAVATVPLLPTPAM